MTANDLVESRNRADGALVALVTVAADSVKGHAERAARNLSAAKADAVALGAGAPTDDKFVAAQAVIAAAQAFVNAAQAARLTITSPGNWRPAGSDIDTALKAQGH
jgi:hypothetical protein